MEFWNHICPGCMREIKESTESGQNGRNEINSARHGHGPEGFRCPYCGFSEAEYRENSRCLPLNTILAGKYLVGKVLGEGGFGITYIGYDLNMKARVAIKEYFPVELAARDTTRRNTESGGPISGDRSNRVISMSGEKSETYRRGLKKYVNEARNVSQFSGIPGIVSVKDFFYENDTAYIVMEYIEGVSLKEYLKQKGGKLSEEEALTIMCPVLEALIQVHAAGIVHRDISPDNIMLTFMKEAKAEVPEAEAGQDGTGGQLSTVRPPVLYGNITAVRLIDFGAARMAEKKDQKSLTIILKHGYAPEEQYRSHGDQGPWTDVYALCAVFYRMLTGKVPEPAMDRLFSDRLKRPEELGAKVAPAISEAIMKGLAVKKEDRIQSVRELTDVLYTGKRLKKRGNGKPSLPVLIAALAVGAVAVTLTAAGIMGTLRTGYGVSETGEAGGRNASDVQSADDRNTDGLMDANSPFSAGNSGKYALPEETVLLEEETEEEAWEVMVTRTPQTGCAAGGNHAVFVREDGTVVSCGSNAEGQRNLSEWEHVASVAAGKQFSAGLLENGTVVISGILEGKDDVERWENIMAVAAGGDMIFGLTSDGRLMSNKSYGGNTEFLEWENIRAVAAFEQLMAALTEEGRVLCTGIYGWTPVEISGWEDVTAIACDYYTVYGLCKDGTVKYADMWTDQKPGENRCAGVENMQNVIQLFACNRAVFGVTAQGNVLCAVPEYREDVPVEQTASWEGIVGAASDNGGNVAGLKADGTLIKASFSYGNREPETMTDLKRVCLMERSGGDYGTALVGITGDGRLETWGSWSILDRFEYEGVENVQDMAVAYFPFRDGSMEGYIWLDRNGALYMSELQKAGEGPALEQVGQMAVGGWKFNRFSQLCIALMQDGTVTLLSTGGESLEDMPEGFAEAENWENIIQLACCSGREEGEGILIGLKKDGTVETAKSQAFPGGPDADWNGIASIHAGKYAIGAVKKDGTAVFLEDSPEYNYGQYNTAGWTGLTQLALGQYHTAGLRSDGTVYAAGRNDAGQCEVEGWTDVVYITAGDNCTLGIRSDGTLMIAGEVGW